MKWYKKTTFVHLPITPQAFIIDLLAVVFLLTVFMAADRNSHSVSDMLYNIFPYAVSTFLLVEWVASKTDS